MPTLTFDEKWLREYESRTGKGVQGERSSSSGKAKGVTAASSVSLCSTASPKGKPRSKYGNIKVDTEDGKFDSRHEARVYEQIKLRAKAGEIMSVGRQVVFYLPGNIKYIADFVITRKDGATEVIDAKSAATRNDKVYRIKKKLMAATYSIEIIEL